MRFLEWGELLALHEMVAEQSGGSSGIRDAFVEWIRERIQPLK